MDDITSEATSPYSASEMENTSMYNQSNHTHRWYFPQQTNAGMAHSQANQGLFLRGESSQQQRPGVRRPKMSEDQRKERKKQNDASYRLRKKNKENIMTLQIEDLQGKVGRLNIENRHLNEESIRSSAENRQLREENQRLSTKNRDLEVEKKHLEERIRGLQGKGHLAAPVLQGQDSYISQPTSQVDQHNVFVQDHYGLEFNNKEAVYRNHHCMEYNNNEGAVDGCDGLGIEDLRNLLFPENEITQNGRVAINVPAPEHPEGSRSGLCPAEMARAEFLMKLDAEVTSNIDPSDFTGLEGEKRRVGRYRFPLSLIPTVERINNVYGDVSETSRISPSISEQIYVLFCATIREMEHLELEKVTEDIMLKWRDVIKDTLRLSFDVTFAMEHLKKIACAYFGLPECILLQAIDAKISSLEVEVNEWKEKRAKIYEESKTCIDAAEKFIGVPVSTAFTFKSEVAQHRRVSLSAIDAQTTT